MTQGPKKKCITAAIKCHPLSYINGVVSRIFGHDGESNRRLKNVL
jgi:hypothetical protein